MNKDKLAMPIRCAAIIVSAVGISLAIGFAAVFLSPRDPREETPPRGGQVAHHRQQLEGVAKARQILDWVIGGKSIKLREPVWQLIAAGLAVTVPLNVGGLLLAWGLAYVAGLWIGCRLGSLSGRLAVIVLFCLIVIPAPVQIELLRLVLIGHGPFNLRELFPAVLALAWTTFPAMAVYHAVAVSTARRQPTVLMARALGAKAMFIQHHIGVGTAGFWETKAALLVVGLIEGPFIVENAFDLKGAGNLALKTIESADVAVVLPLVALSAVAVNLGTLWTLRSKDDIEKGSAQD